MRRPSKLVMTAFKLSPTTLNRLEQVRFEHGKAGTLLGFPSIPVTKVDVIRALINKEWDRIEAQRLAYEAKLQEIRDEKLKTRVKARKQLKGQQPCKTTKNAGESSRPSPKRVRTSRK